MKRNQSLIGIDISSTAIKLLELTRQSDGYRVEHYSVEPLPPNAVIEKSISDIQAVAIAIDAACKRAGAKCKRAAVAVPGSAAISKVISMPASLSEDELEANIELQAENHIPYPRQEVNLDFEVLGPSEHDPESMDVLLVACRSENVDDRISVLETAGLKPTIVDIESYAIENAFSLLSESMPDGGQGKTVAIVDIGATMTTLNVIHDLKIIYTREQVFGGKQLTEEIMRRYGLSYEEAGLVKRQGGLPDNYIPEVLEPFKDAMVQQVSRSLQFFFSASRHTNVDHVILAGGSASIAGIDELIEAKLDTPTTVANPFANMSVSNRVKAQSLSNDAPAFMIACGLALRSFD